ncbi:MAG: hypothetical protein ACR2KT_11965 [Methylocella sp.]
MIFPAFAAPLPAPPAGSPAPIALPRELFSNEIRDLCRNTGFCRAAGEWDFQSGTRGFGAPEILECYVTVRWSAAPEFKPGLWHGQTPLGSRKI